VTLSAGGRRIRTFGSRSPKPLSEGPVIIGGKELVARIRERICGGPKVRIHPLQRGAYLSSAPRGCRRKAPHFGGGLRVAGDVARVEAREIRHLSVFALAPQPLLIELGRLLGDIVAADVRQLQREPQGWAWRADGPAVCYRVRKADRGGGLVALVLAVSATVTDERIFVALGPETAIWAIEADRPHNDIMKRSADLAEFRRLLRFTFNAIKAAHGEQATIHIFPALPVSAAVEVGRVWMPKADLPLVIYDQNRKLNGFTRALDIRERRSDRRVSAPPLPFSCSDATNRVASQCSRRLRAPRFLTPTKSASPRLNG
jgi:hypothetical protein